MNADYDKQLEQDIDHQLKSLPELVAPPTLMSRVMREIAMRAHLPWYRQAWQSWPISLQAISLLLLLGLFAGISFACWELTRTPGAADLRAHLTGTISAITSFWTTLTVLLNALLLSAKKLGSGFMLGCLLAMGLAYATCIGLGTAYFRLAISGRR